MLCEGTSEVDFHSICPVELIRQFWCMLCEGTSEVDFYSISSVELISHLTVLVYAL